MIRFDGVDKWYGEYQALKGISEDIAKGEVVVLCGPSGSGKSTLIRTINRLEPIKSGTIRIHGADIYAPGTSINKLRARVGFVFQNFNLFPHIDVLKNVMLAQMRVLGRSRAEARDRAL